MTSDIKSNAVVPRRMMMRLATAVLACATVIAAGCSSDPDETNNGSSSPSDSGDTAPTDGGADTDLEQARANVESFSRAPANIGVTAPLAKSPRGKRVAYLQQDIPVMQLIGDNLTEAANVLGMEVERINAGSTPESWGRAFDQVVQSKPDAVLAGPIPAAVVSSQLTELAAMNIPVVVWTSADVPQAGNGITLNFDSLDLYKRQGQLMADWVAVDAGADSDVAFFNIPDFPSLAPLREAFTTRLASVCPGCTVQTVDVGATSIATELPGRVVSHVQQHSTEYVVMAFGDMVIGVPEALAASGLNGNVKLVSASGGQVNYQYVKSGQQAVELALPFGLYGWKLADAVARLVTGESTAPDEAELIPMQFLTNRQITFDLNAPWPGVPSYKDDFKKLWAAAA